MNHSNQTLKIGITGGIGSGKTFVCQCLQKRGYEVYDCDAAAKRLIGNSMEIRHQLTALIGEDAYLTSPDKQPYVLNKAIVARFLLESDKNAKAIDAIVHPAVFRDFKQSGMMWMESAILYESGISKLVDRVIVVTAPDETRICRVMKRDGITREKVLQWMQRQWPQERLTALSDYEIINDGFTDIDTQLDCMLNEFGLALQVPK